MKTLKVLVLLVLIGIIPDKIFAWVGMSTPMLHVEGRYLKDPSGKNVLLHGWMQPIETWFNGEGHRYSNPTDWNNTSNVAGLLNCLKEEATVMSNTSPLYGRSHGWYASFVRVNCDFYGGWTAESGLVNSSQFNGWIQNFVVPYANHLRSRGLYLVLCATGPINTPNNGTHNAGMTEQARLRTLWSTIANASGVKNADNIMFELMNEPVQVESSPGNGNWGSGSSTFFSAFKNWMQPIINDIRNTGANNVIWVPCLGWQGEPHGWAQYPFTGTNIGVAAHFYPAYGGVYNNATAVQNLWNSNYKPAADRWPLMITECYWFPGGTGYDDLFNGTTAGFGNALKNAMDNQGNVQYLVGFIADHLYNLVNSTPTNCGLGSREGTQAYFDWLPTYTWAAPGSGSSSSSSSSSSGSITNGVYRITPRNGGKAVDVNGCGTADGTNVQNWSWLNNNCQKWQFTSLTGGYWRISPMNATSKALDVSGVSTADGANVHIWAYGGGNNQQWQLVSVTGGYYQIKARHSGKCLDLAGGVTTDGANIQQWNCTGSGTNGHFTLTRLSSAEDVLTESLTEYTLYPSPVDENLHITFNGQERVNVRIYNNLGALALSSDFTGDTKTLDVSKLTSGMYFIRLEGNERTITDRFIKK